MSWIDEQLAELENTGLRRARRTVNPLPGGLCELDGRRLVNFASNDYLGLSGDVRLCDAAKSAIEEMGVGAGASALITGRTAWHARLEERIARFEGVDSALLFPTGFAANLGTVSALAGRGDVIFSDALNHASLIDGCRLSRAEVCVYPHRDVAALEEALEQHRDVRRLFIVTDGVFSMDGDMAPLGKVLQLAEEFDALLIVDEAHGTGVLGEGGRGTCELMGAESSRIIRVGTLSKAAGVVGGFVAASTELIELLWNRARSQVFSTAMPAAMCAASVAALDIIEREPEARRHLRNLSQRLRGTLVEKGIPIATDWFTPIIPVVIGDAGAAMKVSEILLEQGILVPAIRPPTVPAGTSRLRISLSASHPIEVIDRLGDCVLRAINTV